MARPKPLEPKQYVHIALPATLYARLRLMFYTDGNAKGILKGAMSEFVVQAIQEKLERKSNDLSGMSLHLSESINEGRTLPQGREGDADAGTGGDPLR
jgi:hypothetical protein